MAEESYSGPAILELMGHRRLGGRLSEQTMAGGTFIRIDIPSDDGRTVMTQFYSPSAVYCITPCSEDIARKVASMATAEPVTTWELSRALPAGQEQEEALL